MEWTNDARTALHVRQVERHEDGRYHEQMARDHDLGALPKIGETVWHVATLRDQGVAQLSRRGRGLDMRRAGSLDRLGRSLAVGAAHADRQQPPLSDSA